MPTTIQNLWFRLIGSFGQIWRFLTQPFKPLLGQFSKVLGMTDSSYYLEESNNQPAATQITQRSAEPDKSQVKPQIKPQAKPVSSARTAKNSADMDYFRTMARQIGKSK